MERGYKLVFDDVIIKQLKKVAKNQEVKTIITKMLDKIETLGPNAGKLLDSQLHIYEVKNNHPPLRLYYQDKSITGEMYIFEFEIKTSGEKQQRTIMKLRNKSITDYT